MNKDTDIFPEEAPLIIFYSKSDVCIANNGKDIKHKMRMNLVRNGKKCNLHKIEWCEGGLQLADIATTNVGEHDLTPKMKYIMVIIVN